MRSVIWIHEDALSRTHPVFTAASDDSEAVFIWDAADLERRGYSFKKLVFIYECLLDMNVEIIEGRTTDILRSYCEEGYSVYFAEPRNPELLHLIAPLRDYRNVIMIKRERLGNVEVTPDMKRFFRYWNKAKGSILETSEQQKSEP